MAAGSNPPARPLVFATQAGSAVSGSTHTGLISDSHRAILITPLMLCGAGTDGEMSMQTDRQADRFHFPHKERAREPGISSSLCVRVFVYVENFLTCNARTASYMLSLSSEYATRLTSPPINPAHVPTLHLRQRSLNSSVLVLQPLVGAYLSPASLSPFKRSSTMLPASSLWFMPLCY